MAQFCVLATVWRIQVLLLICLPSTWESESSAGCVLTLYEFGNVSGEQLVRTTSDSTLVDNGWNNKVSSIRVDGGCQWILYDRNTFTDGSTSSSVVGPGLRTYLNGTFGIPDNSLTSVRCLPVFGTQAIVLFQNSNYYGEMQELTSSNPNLTSTAFNDITSSFIITGGTWQLYSGFNYQGQSVTCGVGIYPDIMDLGGVSNDDLSSVRFVGLGQETGTFTIGGHMYLSQNRLYDALYVYDQSQGSPASLNLTCTSTLGELLEVHTTNELISGSLFGVRVVDNVTITGTSSPVSLDFDPEFLPQFYGIYECRGDGPNVREAVMITTENPFLRLNMGPVTVTGSADMFNITVMGAYTASGGVSEIPTREDYSLVYFFGGGVVPVQDLVFVMDTSPYEQVFLVDVGRNVQNGTNFNLTLSVRGLTTSVIFPAIVQDPAQFVIRPNQTTAVDAGSTITFTCVAYGIPNPSISWNKGDTLLSNDSQITIYKELVTENRVTFVQSILQLCNVQGSDAGQYSCFADNTLGNNTASFAVIARDPAQFVIRPNQTIAVDAGNAITLTCVAYGVPNPSISWNKGDTLLRNDSRVIIYEELVAENEVQSVLQLSNAEEADAGLYSCFADNTLGNDTAFFELTVALIAQICPREVDTGFGITWGNTVPGETTQQSCGTNYTGTATRFCQSDATWAPPDVSQCERVVFVMLRTSAEELFSNVTVVDDEKVAMALGVVSSLATFTEPTTISVFPRDLNTSNYIITNTLDLLLLNLDQGGTTDITATTEVVEVIDNLLDQVNLAGFQDLQGEAPASQSVLKNAERYALYLATAMSQNTSEQGILLSRGNIVIRSERITVTSGTQTTDVTFPEEGDLENFRISSGMSPPEITIPAQLIVERANSSTASVANIVFQNLQDFLPPELNNSTATPASLIISSQVAGASMGSQTLQENPVTITSRVERTSRKEFSCVFWNFSDPIGNGGWSTEGVTTNQVTQDGNNTVVQCSSTHLTSFAVLVNVAGAPVDNLALSIVTYIGLGISLSCLLLTIIFYLSLGKKLFKAVHNFVHLNLVIALFVGYLTFAVGVELARANKAACQAVTAIMQYFFLASFCWMMCEGIMLYLMLVVVFSGLTKKWWFFFLLGWIPPVIFVVIGLSTVLDEYVVYSRNDAGEILTDSAGNDIISFCWLSSGNGTNAIWTFVAPMLAIVLINSVFLILVLVSVIRSRGRGFSKMKDKGKRVDLVVYLVKASLILLPLLGLTWVIGLFAVNENTLVFAWLFTILNSLQGMLIFSFHVLRNERVWGRMKKIFSSTQSKAGDKGTASTSSGKKISRVTNSSGGESTLEMKEKTGASFAYASQFEPNDDEDVAALVISETTISAERPGEEEVKNKSDPTSDQPTNDVVETTAPEPMVSESVEVTH